MTTDERERLAVGDRVLVRAEHRAEFFRRWPKLGGKEPFTVTKVLKKREDIRQYIRLQEQSGLLGHWHGSHLFTLGDS